MALTRLSDEQMKGFIRDGYIAVKTGLPAEAHQDIWDKTETLFETEGNPGNNLMARIPEVRKIFDDPTVDGALAGVLGDNYFMHPHRHCHINRAGQPAQGWHKDSYWGFMKVRHHRPWWAMIFYYPQDVTLENGPSSVVPGSQYYEDATLGAEEPGVPVLGEAGTVMLIQYDVWHRAAANASSKNRYMLKFQFVRTAPPIPSVHPTTPWRRPEHFEPTNDHDVVWGAMWDWTHGTRSRLCLAAEEVGALVDGLKAEESSERASAADRLGTLGSAAAEAVSHLSEALTDVHEPVRINAAYALSAIGPDAVPSLEAVFAENSELATRYAAMACAGLGSAGVPLLIDAIDRPEASNRDHVAHALGEIGPDAQASICNSCSSATTARVGAGFDQGTPRIADLRAQLR